MGTGCCELLARGDLKDGPRRNFQVFSALGFLAEVTQHIPCKIGSDLNPATTNGPARASWDNSGGENCAQMLDNRPNYGQPIRPMRIKIPLSHCLQFATGFSGAAWASVKLSKRYPQMIAGVLLHGHSGNHEYCVPGQSVTFLYGAKDQMHAPAAVEGAIGYYQKRGYHLNAKKLDAGHAWGGLEDTITMLEFMFDFQRFNNPSLTKDDIANDMKSELDYSSKIEDVAEREQAIFDYLSSYSSAPKLLKSTGQDLIEAWGEAYLATIEPHLATPTEAFQKMNFSTRKPLTQLLRGDARFRFKSLMDELEKDEAFETELDAQKTYDRLFSKEAKIASGSHGVPSLVGQYEKLIERYSGTLAAKEAENRIAQITAHKGGIEEDE